MTPLWDMNYALSIFPEILSAFVNVTLVVTLVSSGIAAVLGLLFAFILRTGVPVLGPFTRAFVEFVRSTPTPIQLFFVVYALPSLPVVGVQLPLLTAGILVMGVHYACYYSEVYRGGIESVPKGQWEACTALSLPRRYQWQRVVLPQAVRNSVPALGNNIISMFKETPFLVVIGVAEMVQASKDIGGASYRYIEPLTIAGLIFLAASYPTGLALRKLEKRLEHA